MIRTYVFNRLQNETPFERQCAVLSDDEVARLDQLKVGEVARDFAFCRYCVRRVVAEHVGAAPGEIVLPRAPGGRPDLKARYGVDASWSRSGPLTAIAIVTSGRVGIDIERRRELAAGVADLIGSPSDRACLNAMEARLRPAALARLWTVKEAALKAAGAGFQSDPRDLVVPTALIEGCKQTGDVDAFGRRYELRVRDEDDHVLALAHTSDTSLTTG